MAVPRVKSDAARIASIDDDNAIWYFEYQTHTGLNHNTWRTVEGTLKELLYARKALREDNNLKRFRLYAKRRWVRGKWSEKQLGLFKHSIRAKRDPELTSHSARQHQAEVYLDWAKSQGLTQVSVFPGSDRALMKISHNASARFNLHVVLQDDYKYNKKDIQDGIN